MRPRPDAPLSSGIAAASGTRPGAAVASYNEALNSALSASGLSSANVLMPDQMMAMMQQLLAQQQLAQMQVAQMQSHNAAAGGEGHMGQFRTQMDREGRLTRRNACIFGMYYMYHFMIGSVFQDACAYGGDER
jgi:hypothetical protein